MGVFRRTGRASADVATGRRVFSLPHPPLRWLSMPLIGVLQAVYPPPILFVFYLKPEVGVLQPVKPGETKAGG